MQELAAELSRPAVAVSFFPTSRMVFGNSGFLSSAREKTVLLSDFGPAAIVLIPFSREYAATDKQVFLKQIKALEPADRKSTRLNSSHVAISYAVFCLKKK